MVHDIKAQKYHASPHDLTKADDNDVETFKLHLKSLTFKQRRGGVRHQAQTIDMSDRHSQTIDMSEGGTGTILPVMTEAPSAPTDVGGDGTQQTDVQAAG